MAPPSSWSDIPLELAGLVLRRLLAHVDRVRFAAVCPQWRAAAREAPLPSPLPLLALPDGTVYSLPGSERLNFPASTGYADACGGNWLAFSTEDGFFLREPFSNATVTLPQQFRARLAGSWVEMRDAPVRLTICRLVFCSRQLIATFVRFASSAMVAVCQPGATWWSVYMDRHFELFYDMAFHQGKLYILTQVNNGLFAIDISVDHRTGDPWVSRVQQVISGVVIPSPAPAPAPAITGIYQNISQWTHYLVELESHGVLLMVHKKTYGEVRTATGTLTPPERIEFEVFRADFQQSRWTKVTTIGDDQVLFLRRRCSRFVCVSPEEMPGDRIVFLDNEDCYTMRDSASVSFKVYDMRDGTVSPFLPSVHWDRLSVPATWLFPQV